MLTKLCEAWTGSHRVRGIKIWLARALIDPLDLAWRIWCDKKHLPPWSMRAIAGRRQFEESGIRFLREFQVLCSLKQTESVLDIGCGCGRVALPLARFLNPAGKYVGVDVDPKLIDWSQNHIGKRNPNFSFHHIDVANRQYNLGGSLNACTYRLPFDDASFHLIVALSLFTHMLQDEMENYLKECARLLVPGGHCLATFFLLNQEQDGLQRKGAQKLNFRYGNSICRYVSEHLKERAVAYSEEYIRHLGNVLGLETKAINYGNWTGRPGPWHSQDIVAFHSSRDSPLPQGR